MGYFSIIIWCTFSLLETRVPAHCIIAIGHDAIVVRDNTLATIKTNGKKEPLESTPKSPVDDPSISGEDPQDSENPIAQSPPSDFLTKEPFLVALPGKRSSKQDYPACPKNRSLANVRYLRRVDEVLGVRYPPSQITEPGPVGHHSLLAQAFKTGKLWFEKAITWGKPSDFR